MGKYVEKTRKLHTPLPLKPLPPRRPTAVASGNPNPLQQGHRRPPQLEPGDGGLRESARGRAARPSSKLGVLISERRRIPSASEIDQFFAAAEQLLQNQFVEKYNYDPLSDCPLPGRYEWARLDA